LFFLLALLIAQVPSPQASAAVSPMQPLVISWPARIDISAASAANFNRFNQGSGTIMVSIGCNGNKNPMIPPSPDIDSDLKSALTKFLSDTKVTAGKSCHSQTFIVHFEVPSGNMTETELPPPPG
jgi:hypothetical protein